MTIVETIYFALPSEQRGVTMPPADPEDDLISRENIKAVLTALDAAGLVVAPRELTLEMSKAASAKIPTGHGQAWVYFPEVWAAVLAARPGAKT